MKVYQVGFIREKDYKLQRAIYKDKEKAVKYVKEINNLIVKEHRPKFLGVVENDYKRLDKVLSKGKQHDNFILEMEVIE